MTIIQNDHKEEADTKSGDEEKQEQTEHIEADTKSGDEEEQEQTEHIEADTKSGEEVGEGVGEGEGEGEEQEQKQTEHIEADTKSGEEAEEHPDTDTKSDEGEEKQTVQDKIIENNNNNNNDNEEQVIITTKVKKTRVKKDKPKKVVQPKFSSNCSNCQKLFKNIKLYEKHTIEQVCYKDNEITYCKICIMTYTTHNDYKKHLCSIQHINNIGCNTIEKINTYTTNSVHSLDPYLNSNDVETISSKNLGAAFTLVFEEGNTQTITLNKNTKISKDETDTISKTMNETINETSSQPIHEHLHPIPTNRQIKIINFLENQISQNNTIDKSGDLFYKMLDNKLQIDDYKYLQKIINNLTINNDYKLNYTNTINLFISYLVTEKTKGNKNYKDKDISQLVINLTL